MVTSHPRHAGPAGASLAAMATTAPDFSERRLPVTHLRESFARLRVAGDALVEPVRRSLAKVGQLGPITAWCDSRQEPEGLEVLDGFKRLRAARTLSWTHLRVRVLQADAADAVAAIATLNASGALTEMEEALLCRALYREHRLTQPEIAARMGRHKSWVCRRLTLAESLHEQVRVDVRLGLLAPRAACEIARLPHGNQPAASVAAQRRGMTVAQVVHLVQHALALPDATAIAAHLHAVTEERTPVLRMARAASAPNEAQLLLRDVDTAMRVAARLQSRLRARPWTRTTASFVAPITEALGALDPVLAQLRASVGRALAGEDLRDAAMEQPRGA